MKVTLAEIVNAQELIKKLAGEKFPVKVAYQIQKILRAIAPDVQQYEQQRGRLIMEKYGVRKKDEEGKETDEWYVPQDKMPEYMTELSELNILEIDLPVNKVKLPDSYEITPSEVFLLSWMLDVEDEYVEEKKE